MIWKHKNLLGLTVENETVFKHPSVDGLRLRAYPTGRKTWQWTRMVEGRAMKKSLGRFPAVSLVEAEAEARELNEQIESGRDPTVIVEPEPVVRITVADAWDNFIKDCERRQVRSVYHLNLTGLKDIVGTIGDKFMADVSADDIREVINQPILRGKGNTGGRTRSNGVLKVCKTFFGGAALEGVDGMVRDPAAAIKGIPKSRIIGRKKPRPLTVREMALAILAAREFDRERGGGSWADYITLLVLTGCRKSEVADAFGSAWDRENRNFVIDAIRYKTGVDCVLPVGPTASAILDRCAKDREYIIKSSTAIRTGWDGLVIERLRQLMEKIGGEPVEKWTPHHIRHGFRTRIRQEKIADSDLAERIIHPGRAADMATLYDQDWDAEMRDALTRWDARIQEEIRTVMGLKAVA